MQRKRRLARVVAVVGAGMSKFGMYKDKNSADITFVLNDRLE